MKKTYCNRLLKATFFLGLLCCISMITQANNTYDNGKTLETFGHWSMSKEAFDYIRSAVPDGGIVLEFGSGWATGQLSKHYTIYSVEHNKKWLNKFDSNYIYAPIVNSWYDENVLDELPKQYDVLLIDGPPGHIGRDGILKYLDRLDLENTLIIVDDVHREAEHDLLVKLAELLGCDFEVHPGAGQLFGVIHT